MAISGYRFAGAFLAQAGALFDVQHQNMGMLELNINTLVPGAKEPLSLSLAKFEVPGRKFGVAQLPYLAGNANYLTRPEKQENMKVTFRDYPLALTRAFLVRWCRLCFDEETGLQIPSSLLKISGSLVLFQTNATAERSARIEGILPTGLPSVAVDYAQGEVMPMDMEFAIDRVVWDSSLFSPAAA